MGMTRELLKESIEKCTKAIELINTTSGFSYPQAVHITKEIVEERKKFEKWLEELNTIEELKKFTRENYSNGGDVMVECWDNRDWEDFMDKCKEYKKQPKRYLKEIMRIHDERRKGIENTAY